VKYIYSYFELTLFMLFLNEKGNTVLKI